MPQEVGLLVLTAVVSSVFLYLANRLRPAVYEPLESPAVATVRNISRLLFSTAVLGFVLSAVILIDMILDMILVE